MTEQLCRLDLRISRQDKTLLKRRCEEFNMTQTDYMRMLINLPLRMVDEGMEEESDLFVIDRWGRPKSRGRFEGSDTFTTKAVMRSMQSSTT